MFSILKIICYRLHGESFFVFSCRYVFCNDFCCPLDQVKELLADDPANSEYVDMERELNEVSFFSVCFYIIFLYVYFMYILSNHLRF